MQWYEAEVQALQRACAGRVNGTRHPVFYGSSSIRMWVTLAEDIDPSVVNLGFGGSTLEACDYFFDRLVPPVKPASLLLYAGDNDLGDGRSPEQVLASFRSLARKRDAALGGVPFGFISIKPSPARFGIIDRIRKTNDLVRAEVEATAGGYYVDIYSSMLDEAGQPRPEFYSPDGLHLNREGYRLWAGIVNTHRHQFLTQ